MIKHPDNQQWVDQAVSTFGIPVPATARKPADTYVAAPSPHPPPPTFTVGSVGSMGASAAPPERITYKPGTVRTCRCAVVDSSCSFVSLLCGCVCIGTPGDLLCGVQDVQEEANLLEHLFRRMFCTRYVSLSRFSDASVRDPQESNSHSIP